jgi:hypothetical protein
VCLWLSALPGVSSCQQSGGVGWLWGRVRAGVVSIWGDRIACQLAVCEVMLRQGIGMRDRAGLGKVVISGGLVQMFG